MGYMRHHGILVTSCIDNLIEQAHAKAVEICGNRVSPLNTEQVNGYRSFAVFPDGSKEGWDDSDQGDKEREQLKTWLNAQRYEDGSTSLDWVEVQYGDDNGETCIIADSDHPEEATVVDAVIMLPD